MGGENRPEDALPEEDWPENLDQREDGCYIGATGAPQQGDIHGGDDERSGGGSDRR